MKCEHIRESLLTDYPDGQLDPAREEEIRQHLSSCVQCRKLSDVVCRSLIEPFTDAEKFSLPREKVWNNITQRIKEEQAPAHRQSVTITRPVFALLTVTVTALIVMVYFNAMRPGDADLSRSSESDTKYISYIADELSDNEADDYVDYGTDIERYFL